MRLIGRSGSSTVELVAGVVLWGVLSTAVVGALLATGRAARGVAVRAEQREMLRAAALVSASELRQSAGGPATLRVTNREIEYRSRRWTSLTCGWAAQSGGRLRITLPETLILGERPPLAGRDSVLVWIEGYPSERDDGRWHAAVVTAVGAASCPGVGPGLFVDLEPWWTADPSSLVHPGMPVVGYERAALRIYRGGEGEYWLGQATAGPGGWNSVQPIAGPLSGASGFALRADGQSVVLGLRSAGAENDSVEVIVTIRAEPEGGP